MWRALGLRDVQRAKAYEVAADHVLDPIQLVGGCVDAQEQRAVDGLKLGAVLTERDPAGGVGVLRRAPR